MTTHIWGSVHTAEEEQLMRAAFLRLHSHTEALRAAADSAAASARNAYTVSERDAARALHRATESAEADAAEALENALTVVQSRAERLAPGLALRDFFDPAWRSGEWLGAGARYLRIGSAGDAPALVPLLDAGNIVLSANEEQTWSFGALHSLLLRALATAPAGRCEVIVYDPKLRGALSPFSALRKEAGELFGEPIATGPVLLEKLHEARDAALRMADLAGAHDAEDVAELRALTGMQTEPYRLFVLLDYPYGVDARIHAEVMRLAHAGPRRGVSMLIHHDPSLPRLPNETELNMAGLFGDSVVVRSNGGAVELSTLPGVDVHCDASPPRALIEQVCHQVANLAAAGAAPVVEFRDLLPDPALVWSADGTEGLTAVIGKSGLDLVKLRLRGADPALANALIGGASGQGKSNLLLVLLHSIAASYSPDEVEMYLLDFKEGLEFDRLGPSASREHWLPHAKVLGLEGDRLFGLAVLRHIEEQFRRRAERFRAGDANSLAAYRQAHPDEVLPRLLVVIDEFQVLVAESDDIGREAISILENLSRRGRAVGIHLVLASQTLSGIDTLASKERSIFGQFPWRLSLKTESSESEAVLGRGNTAAASLRYRGELVLNSDYGAMDANRRAVVAFAEERQLDRLRHMLWSRWQPQQRLAPRVFYASRPSEPDLLEPSAKSLGDRDALLGLPITVDSVPVSFSFDRAPGRVLAIIGDGRNDALGILHSAAYSLGGVGAAGNAASSEFVILDGARDSSNPTPQLERLADDLVAAGHAVSVREESQMGDALLELGALVDERLNEPDVARRRVYVLAAGLHRAARLGQFSMSGRSPAEALSRIVRDGPLVEVFLIGWWGSLRVFNEQLGYDVAPLVAGALFLRAPESDVQALCGPYVRYQARPHRGLFVDRGQGAEPVPVVPFACPGGA
ncbi:MAG: hypothetical protein HOQ05_08815 [Corynebacteriales bacterium]|nr:hypothetical protein [Mycobacteriales bacterium]